MCGISKRPFSAGLSGQPARKSIHRTRVIPASANHARDGLHLRSKVQIQAGELGGMSSSARPCVAAFQVAEDPASISGAPSVCAGQLDLLAALTRPNAKVRDQGSEATRYTGARPDRNTTT